MAELRQRKTTVDEPPASDVAKPKLSKKKVTSAVPNQRWYISLRFLSRFVVITSLVIVAYYSTKMTVKTFAKQSEELDGKYQVVLCSEEYEEELKKFKGCAPQQCKRVVSDKIVNPFESELLLGIAKKTLALASPVGGAATFDLHSGALSKDKNFINFYKLPQAKNVLEERDLNLIRNIKEKLKGAIVQYFDVTPFTLYMTHPAFFSELTSKEPKTVHDEYWHPHVDKVSYGCFHFTCLIYLSDYGIDFSGGRFVFLDKNQNKTLEPRKGRVSIFTSGAENTHHIERVTRGERYAFTLAFTCDKKFAIDETYFK